MPESSRCFVLIQDESCHWYVIPADKQDEASAYIEACSAYWESGSKHEGGLPAEPEWFERVGGAPSLVEFTGYTIK